MFDAPFAGRTSAHPEDGRNPGDNKLGVIGPRYAPSADGTFHARRAARGSWHAFEYHPTHPRMLELTNHVRPAACCADDLIAPGTPFTLCVRFGADSVRWGVDGATVFADGTGVGPAWRAWLIVGIGVSAGAYGHLPPRPGTDELAPAVHRPHRPAPGSVSPRARVPEPCALHAPEPSRPAPRSILCHRRSGRPPPGRDPPPWRVADVLRAAGSA